MKYINKKLTIEKMSVQNIANKYGTPAYCYSYNQLKENIDSATIALNPSWLKQVEKVHKAIPNPAP